MNTIDQSNWKKFIVKNIFNCESCKPYSKNELEDGEVNYITRTADNNGVSGRVNNKNKISYNGNCITIGAVGYKAFYQRDVFVAGTGITRLTNSCMNKYNALFICTVLNKMIPNYSYDNERTFGKIKQETIKLPVDPDGNPDWDYMTEFMKDIERRSVFIQTFQNKKITTKNEKVDTSNWKEFKISDLFDCKNGSMHKVQEQRTENALPYYVSSKEKNGFGGYTIDYKEKDIIKVPSLTVGSRGNDAITFYHDGGYIANQNLTVMIPKDNISKEAMLFVATLIRKQKDKYSYSNIMSKQKVMDTIIKLPVDSESNPDWNYMTEFMKDIERRSIFINTFKEVKE